MQFISCSETFTALQLLQTLNVIPPYFITIRSNEHTFVTVLALPRSLWQQLVLWQPAMLKNGNDVIFLQWVLRFGRNSVAWCRMTGQLREVVEIKTGSRIPIWWAFVFPNQKHISAINWYILTIDVDEIVGIFWLSGGKDINKYETGSSIKRLRPPSCKIDMTSYFDPEWHDNNSDEVKIVTENLTDWKQKIVSLVVQACKPGCYSCVRGCVLAGVEQLYTGNLLTVVLAYYMYS